MLLQFPSLEKSLPQPLGPRLNHHVLHVTSFRESALCPLGRLPCLLSQARHQSYHMSMILPPQTRIWDLQLYKHFLRTTLDCSFVDYTKFHYIQTSVHCKSAYVSVCHGLAIIETPRCAIASVSRQLVKSRDLAPALCPSRRLCPCSTLVSRSVRLPKQVSVIRNRS